MDYTAIIGIAIVVIVNILTIGIFTGSLKTSVANIQKSIVEMQHLFDKYEKKQENTTTDIANIRERIAVLEFKCNENKN